jgi:hypothetical protein
METTAVLKRVTLAEMGQRLGHGILQDGKWSGGYELRRPMLDVEIEIDDSVQQPGLEEYPGRRMAWSLRTALESLCGKKMRDLSDKEALSMITLLPYTDVILLMYARFALKNPTIPTGEGTKCQCAHMIPAGSLIRPGGMDVDMLEPWRECPTLEIELDEPTEIEGLGTVKMLIVQVPSFRSTWYDMTEQQMRNGLRMRSRLVEPAIVGTDKHPVDKFVPPPEGYLARSMLRSDYEKIESKVLTFCGGVRPAFPLACPKCEADTLFPFRLSDLGLY